MAAQARSLQGRVVAITGGARGIGKATASALVRKGARVAIGDLDRELAERTASELGGETLALELDVTRRDSFEGFLDQVTERLGSLDVLINNAGIMPIGDFLEEDDLTARRMIDINLHGVLFGMKLALPGMKRRGSGHIINLASQAGKAGFPGGATYCATKHAVVGVSEAVRAELRDTGVEVSCVMPAVVNTELGAGLVETRGVKKVEPEDVADAIVDALERPRFDVFVPRETIAIYKVMQLLPRRAREGIARFMRADQVLARPNQAERAAYEERAAHSEPALEDGPAAGGEPPAEPPTDEPAEATSGKG
ncbi:MAG: SDR family NAD(P)-dependent oxidoreductase [Solirubrobacterales bacterium]|nr:SDR family NAD(P)-dependent oxidoreductase [Solirubrobacterales bacterium]